MMTSLKVIALAAPLALLTATTASAAIPANPMTASSWPACSATVRDNCIEASRATAGRKHDDAHMMTSAKADTAKWNRSDSHALSSRTRASAEKQ